MYGIALGTPLKSVAKSFSRLRFFGIAWSLNFILVPLIGYLLASLFLSGTPLIFLRFILYVVTPCTDWFLVFTGMAKGDVPLGLALLPTQLVLQIVLISRSSRFSFCRGNCPIPAQRARGRRSSSSS